MNKSYFLLKNKNLSNNLFEKIFFKYKNDKLYMRKKYNIVYHFCTFNTYPFIYKSFNNKHSLYIIKKYNFNRKI